MNGAAKAMIRRGGFGRLTAAVTLCARIDAVPTQGVRWETGSHAPGHLLVPSPNIGRWTLVATVEALLLGRRSGGISSTSVVTDAELRTPYGVLQTG